MEKEMNRAYKPLYSLTCMHVQYGIVFGSVSKLIVDRILVSEIDLDEQRRF